MSSAPSAACWPSRRSSPSMPRTWKGRCVAIRRRRGTPSRILARRSRKLWRPPGCASVGALRPALAPPPPPDGGDAGRASLQHADVGLASGAAEAAGWDLASLSAGRKPPLLRRSRGSGLEESLDVQELASSWADPSRWSLVVRGAWSREGVIHNLEGRVALMGLRRVCRSSKAHGHRVLSLTDNMAVAMPFDRGRSRDFGLNVLAARAAAYQLACNIVWIIRYIRSEANATHHDSRAADRGEVPPG